MTCFLQLQDYYLVDCNRGYSGQGLNRQCYTLL